MTKWWSSMYHSIGIICLPWHNLLPFQIVFLGSLWAATLWTTCFFCYHVIGLLNRFLWMQRRNPLCSDDVLLFKTSISFVDHLQEFLSAVLTCTTLVIPPPREWRANPASLANLIKVAWIFALMKHQDAYLGGNSREYKNIYCFPCQFSLLQNVSRNV